MGQRTVSIASLLFLLAGAESSRASTTVTTFAEGEATSGGVEGMAPVGANVSIDYMTVLGPKTLSAPVDATGHYHQTLPAAVVGTIVSVSSPLCPPGTPPSSLKYAFNRFEPGKNTVVTVATFLPGSSATLGGVSFNVVGGFTTRDTAVDYDPSSPTHGDLSGVLVASLFSLSGTGPAGKVTAELSSDEPYTVNLLPIWSASNPNGLSVPLSVPINGSITLNSIQSTFNGKAEGSVAFFTNATELLSLNLNLSSDFGPITGTLDAHSQEFVEPVPEPAGFATLLIGLSAIALGSRLRLTLNAWNPRISPRSVNERTPNAPKKTRMRSATLY